MHCTVAAALAALIAVLVGTTTGSTTARDSRPNFVFVLADDLNADYKNDRLQWMPTVKRYLSEGGAEFVNHIAAVPVCGPSRSSLLQGRFPHNVGYLMNGDVASVNAWVRHGGNNTIGKWLRDAGYHTSFHGKYVNSCEKQVPHGWSHWGGFINTYDFYNASHYDMDWRDGQSGDPPVTVKYQTGVHQGDFLGNLTIQQARKAVEAGKPFFIHVTPVMPHWGTCYGPGIPESAYPNYDPHFEWKLTDPRTGESYSLPISPCPSDRHRHHFDNQSNPRIDGVWNVSITGPRPSFMREAFESKNKVDMFTAHREDLGWRNRSASLLDLDHMLSEIVQGLEELEVINNTFIFFSADNGYHLGEHKMPFGKGEPYDTDVRLPFYVRGPGVRPNVTLSHPTNLLDITATIVDLAGATDFLPFELDGLSFAKEIVRSAGDPAPDADSWRQFAFSEFFANNNTWRLVRVANSTHKFSYVHWCTNESEVFNMQADPWQSSNIYGTPGFAAAVVEEFAGRAAWLGSCSGNSCHDPQPVKSVLQNCYRTLQPQQVYSGSFNVVEAAGTKIVHGWAVDFSLDGTSPQGKPAGFDPATVRILASAHPLPGLPDFVANVSRPDIMWNSGLPIPNPNHGFSEVLPTAVLQQKHVSLMAFIVGKGQSLHPLSNERPVCLCSGSVCPCD